MDLPMEKDHFDIDILPIFVEKVLQEMRHGLVRYVTAYHNMSVSGSVSGSGSRWCWCFGREINRLVPQKWLRFKRLMQQFGLNLVWNMLKLYTCVWRM